MNFLLNVRVEASQLLSSTDLDRPNQNVLRRISYRFKKHFHTYLFLYHRLRNCTFLIFTILMFLLL